MQATVFELHVISVLVFVAVDSLPIIWFLLSEKVPCFFFYSVTPVEELLSKPTSFIRAKLLLAIDLRKRFYRSDNLNISKRETVLRKLKRTWKKLEINDRIKKFQNQLGFWGGRAALEFWSALLDFQSKLPINTSLKDKYVLQLIIIISRKTKGTAGMIVKWIIIPWDLFKYFGIKQLNKWY